MQLQEIDQAQNQAKQLNAIRKAAIQSFQPVVTKMEQHIAFLIAQTTKLREKNQVLERTVMDHNVINQAVAELREDINKVKFKIGDTEQRNQKENINLKGEIVTLTVQLEKVNSELKRKQAKINDLFQKNIEQSTKIDTTATNFKQIVEQYVSQVSGLELSNKKLSQNLTSLNSQFDSQIKILSDSIHEKDQKIQQSSQKLQLYMSQREELKKLIQNIWAKVDKTVDIEKYENDWRIIRMENQEMKRQNKKMIDEALTPDVRKFLPEMMQRMEEIRKVNRLQQFAYQQKAKNDKFEIEQNKQIQNLKQQLQKSRQYTQKLGLQLKTETLQKFTILSSKLQQGNESATQTISQVQEQTTKLILQKQSEIRTQIAGLLDKNRQNIYKMVVDLIPQEEKDFFDKMKQFMPILESTKKQIMERCDQITQFGRGLEERLESFNNRIVKIKGDVSVDIETVKKKSKNMQNSIMIIADNFKSLGKVISAYCELFLLQYSLSFDPFEKQVYVTGADGIIYESSDSDSQIYYRKVRTSRDQIRRSTLSNLIKLTDSLISQEEYGFMFVGENKPSVFFKSIKQSILQAQPLAPVSRKKQRKFSIKMREGSLQNKLPIIDNNQSKTIDFSQQDISSKDIQAQTLTSDFSKARKKQRPYRGRYSQMK